MPGRVTLAADTGAVAHLFVLEEDIARLLLLADGSVTSPRSWAIAPGAADVAEPGRDRMDVAVSPVLISASMRPAKRCASRPSACGSPFACTACIAPGSSGTDRHGG